jgi:hypothetical protein
MRDEVNEDMETPLLDGMTWFGTLTCFFGWFICSGFAVGYLKRILVVTFHCHDMCIFIGGGSLGCVYL